MKSSDVLAIMVRDAIHAEAYRIAHGILDSTPAAMRIESDEAHDTVAQLTEEYRALVGCWERLAKICEICSDGTISVPLVREILESAVAAAGSSALAREAETTNPNYITTTQGMSGWFAVMLWWNPEMDGFWEPWNTGIGRYATEAEAAAEGRDWAAAEGLEFHENKTAQVPA